MPILNYTTTVAAEKTMGEIQAILARSGARKIATDYAAGGKTLYERYLHSGLPELEG